MSYRDNLFGSRPSAGREQSNQRAPPSMNYSRPGQQQPPPPGAPQQQYGGGNPRGQSQPMRSPAGQRAVALRPAKSHGGNAYALANFVSVSPQDFPGQKELYLLLNGRYVVTAVPHQSCPPGEIGLTDPQRTWAGISVGPNDVVEAMPYDPFSNGKQSYLGAIDAEVGFAGRKTIDTQYDQDELSDMFTKTFQNQVLAPGQIVIMDHKNYPLKFTIQTVQLADLSMEKEDESPTLSDPLARGILTPQTHMNLFKDARTGINLKASARRPAANSILQPNFKFEDLGIGGLDTEFSMIFRKAFASRLFPPGLVQNMGIMHVKGILLYGPPGTGKTLIARRIGQMLNAREPKVINGPEVLNKYVGQSEENIRKLFADAEKEYKEKGDESGLHIIIFDELDAVCKQRGSGSAGGTGVGDSVVNQLLSKLDGVDQLNNILLIGMTNRKDMIDEALLRAGRLEVHIEIGLPDEKGRAAILGIHTNAMRQKNILDRDVNLEELASKTKNFSGAEISGLVRAAGSFAFSRSTKVGQAIKIDNDLSNFKVTRDDFLQALEETKPLFGVAEEAIGQCLTGGILHYSPTVESILIAGQRDVQTISDKRNGALRTLSTLLYGPPGSGKTALAAKLAIDSDFPFIKLVTAQNMVGYSEMSKVQELDKIFRDSDKSNLSVVLIDDIELLVDWNPIGPRFSNTVVTALKSLIPRAPPGDRRRLVLATTSERSTMAQLQLLRYFTGQIAVPNVNSQSELGWLLQETNAFEGGAADARTAIGEIQNATGGQEIGVGIKQILTAIKQSRAAGQDQMNSFVDLICQAIADRG